MGRTLEATVYVVDDDPGVCAGLRILLRSAGYEVETFTSARQFLTAIDSRREGCLLLDVRMPGMSGLELQRQLIDQDIPLPVIIITGHGDIQMAVHAVQAGAVDFLEKPVDNERLLNSISKALELNAELRDKRARRAEIEARFAQLTARETEVMQRLIAGRSNKEIAAEFGVSNQAIDAHRKRILRKLEVDTVTEIAWMAYIIGLPAPESLS